MADTGQKVQKKIFVAGDISKDFYIVKGKRLRSFIKEKTGTLYLEKLGGAYMIYEFLKNFSTEEKNYYKAINKAHKEYNKDHKDKKALYNASVVKFGYNESAYKKLTDKNKTYASISEFKKDNRNIWGIDKNNGFEGFGFSEKEFELKLKDVKPRSKDYNVVVIDDAGMEYSLNSNKAIWNKQIFIDNINPELLIYKKSGFTNKGALLKQLFSERKKKGNESKSKLMIVLSIEDIRKNSVKISNGISWEQTILDLIYELYYSDLCKEILYNSDYLIITFGTAGALLIINKSNDNFEHKIIFDPEHLEGEWESKLGWDIIGKMNCFVAALTARLDISQSDFGIEKAIKASLSSLREFHLIGYSRKENSPFINHEKISKAVFGNVFNYSSAFAPSPASSNFKNKKNEFLNLNWSILLDNFTDGKISKGVTKIMMNIAREVVFNGSSSLKNVPYLKFGKEFFTVDRKEIEDLRNIKSLATNYLYSMDENKPLSILILGPPGAGKSYIVKKIAKEITKNSVKEIPILEFNLSQFKTTEELSGAYQLIRDKVLLGIPPVVFWDEFDSDNFKWLKSLISPMQDSSFLDGQIIHPLGKCIFIFAGAVCSSTDELKSKRKNDDFVGNKGPDFISRLHGTLDIMGLNKREKDETDILYPTRRAMFIRSMLRLDENAKLEIDWGLLNALLMVKKYENGSRSLENLLKQIKINKDRDNIQRSDLPSEAIMKLYVDTKDFMECINSEPEHSINIFEIAPKIHKSFIESETIKDEEVKIDYQYLSTFLKASNIAAAERMSEILRKHGLEIVSNDHEPILTEEEYSEYIGNKKNNYHLKMAKMEHELWMKFYDDNNWKHGEVKNNYEKKHSSMVSWDKLSENEKKKDLNMIVKYFGIIKESGLGIARG